MIREFFHVLSSSAHMEMLRRGLNGIQTRKPPRWHESEPWNFIIFVSLGLLFFPRRTVLHLTGRRPFIDLSGG